MQVKNVNSAVREIVPAQPVGLQSGQADNGAGNEQKGKKTVDMPDQSRVREVVHSVNNALKTLSRQIEFSMDQDTGTAVVKVVDQDTHEVLRQIPSEEMLNIAKSLDRLVGLLVRDKA